jgi:uncharacterized protein (DUF934 family)
MAGADTAATSPRPIYRNGRFEADPWSFPDDDTPLPAAGDVAVGKSRFVSDAAALRARQGGIGVILTAGETLDGIVEHLDRITLIALRFARYTDGRPYSLARLLRDRHGYRSELRATGDVLRDQVTFLMRAGFDSLDVAHEGTCEALRAGTIVGIRRHYQPASAASEEAAPVGAWRRLSR